MGTSRTAGRCETGNLWGRTGTTQGRGGRKRTLSSFTARYPALPVVCDRSEKRKVGTRHKCKAQVPEYVPGYWDWYLDTLTKRNQQSVKQVFRPNEHHVFGCSSRTPNQNLPSESHKMAKPLPSRAGMLNGTCVGLVLLWLCASLASSSFVHVDIVASTPEHGSWNLRTHLLVLHTGACVRDCL